MKKLVTALSCVSLLAMPVIVGSMLSTGCVTTAPSVNMTNVVRSAEIIRVVVRTGVLVDAIANTAHVPLIQKSLDGLNSSLSTGSLTGGQLIVVVAGLPLDRTTVQIVSGSLLIYDSLSVLFMTPDSKLAVYTIGKAVAAGAEEGLALAKTQAGSTGASVARSVAGVRTPAPAFVPVPTKANTRKF